MNLHRVITALAASLMLLVVTPGWGFSEESADPVDSENAINQVIDKVSEENEELAAELERLERHLFDIRAQAVTEKLEDPSLLGKAKRDIARIKTIAAERARAGTSAAE